ncbi:MAG: ThuA domain-containing protein, partial [Candidatus Dormibacteraeota bacterium]|nr:ThuA domain-containing protein [Candidatus Dormibacteraeota bacterium]
LHSAHMSRVFRRLMGTPCTLRWRRGPEGERELVWTVAPGHPLTRGVPHPLVIPHQEMYGEFFAIPEPDELVFVSSFEGGEVFRSGCCFRRGAGQIVYFSPGDQDFPVYHQPEIQQVIANAVVFAHGGRERLQVSPQPSRMEPDWFLAAAR